MQTIHAVESDPVESTYANVPDCRAAISRDQLTFLQELTQGTFGKVLLARAVGIEQRGLVTRVAVKTVRGERHANTQYRIMQYRGIVACEYDLQVVGSSPAWGYGAYALEQGALSLISSPHGHPGVDGYV
ncbi:uncharacterized protein LOC119733016 [Patiria miniata]|uniref:Protein kinase domain-containing protein n=1 Tax=Patiria miniata TaxID=46514 RepID=A0A914AEY4_PATMI|nr:uncharacterized protein LOC119733016 [Patiria miniata]